MNIWNQSLIRFLDNDAKVIWIKWELLFAFVNQFIKQLSLKRHPKDFKTPLIDYLLNSFLLQILAMVMAVDHEKHYNFFLDFIFILIHLYK